jgi:hypothetical protein
MAEPTTPQAKQNPGGHSSIKKGKISKNRPHHVSQAKK